MIFGLKKTPTGKYFIYFKPFDEIFFKVFKNFNNIVHCFLIPLRQLADREVMVYDNSKLDIFKILPSTIRRVPILLLMTQHIFRD
ncbi:hypothetical protein CLV98_10690 [Dyadobacter jejuensis]|uniref:Uncharacterized protein n=1 Tax=Dyadobacter jejuensis TaxID=1082580 RepID=A0A316AK32_9BACT|nr:hypothetical protein CLV98_10690 [Dyadobacter jejuensis]